MLSPAVIVVEVQFVKLVDEFSTLDETAGLVPLPPTMLVTGRPAPFAARYTSAVTDPLGLHIIDQPCSVPAKWNFHRILCAGCENCS